MSKWTKIKNPRLTEDLRNEITQEALTYFSGDASLSRSVHITQLSSFIDLASESEVEHSLLGV